MDEVRCVSTMRRMREMTAQTLCEHCDVKMQSILTNTDNTMLLSKLCQIMSALADRMEVRW